MPRYMVVRPFSKIIDAPLDQNGADLCSKVIENNLLDEVIWIHSYIGEEQQQTYMVCDAPSPEAVRSAARRNNHSIDLIVKVRVIDPYFYI